MGMDESESILTTLSDKNDSRSEFDRAFEDDPLYQLQNRMLAKAKTRRFTPEEFIAKAREEFEHVLEVQDKPASDEETPEPEEEFIINFF